MNRRFFVLLFGCLVPFATAFAADADCSCDHLDICTQVNNIPIAFAVRDVVRKKFLDLGAKLLEKDTFVDKFATPENMPYSHVTAFYAEGRRLAELRFTYAKDDFDAIVKDYASFGALAKQVRQTRTGRYWSMSDGVEIAVWQNDDAASVSFTALAIDAQLMAQLRPNYRSPLETNPTLRRLQDANAPVSIRTSNPHQGVFEFHSEAPVLLGKHDLREEVCGAVEDFDWTALQHERQYTDDDKSLYLDVHSDGSAAVKLALNDEFGADIYRFLDVRPGQRTQASVDGDCRRRKVSVTWTATHSPQCLIVAATNRPAYEIVQKLIEVAGVRVDGTELLPREKDRVTLNSLEMNAPALLNLLSEVVDLELVEKGPAHFEFRKATKPAH